MKAVVTFENFRAVAIDKSTFFVPMEYKRSRRMSKELYIAGVSGAAGRAGGMGGAGVGGAFETDDDDDDEDDDDDGVDLDGADGEDGGAMSDREIVRRRAALRNGFDDDEVCVVWFVPF